MNLCVRAFFLKLCSETSYSLTWDHFYFLCYLIWYCSIHLSALNCQWRWILGRSYPSRVWNITSSSGCSNCCWLSNWRRYHICDKWSCLEDRNTFICSWFYRTSRLAGNFLFLKLSSLQINLFRKMLLKLPFREIITYILTNLSNMDLVLLIDRCSY